MIRIVFSLLATASILAVLATPGFAQEPNSPGDPYLVGGDGSKRPMSSAPVPFGFAIGARYDVINKSDFGDPVKFAAGADVYYDTWQLGYHMETYGSVVRLAMRSVGRENWSGWFVETGSGSAFGKDTVTKFNYTLTGVGMQYAIMLAAKGVEAGYVVGWSAGTSNAPGSALYFNASAALVYRIPINTMALSLGLGVNGGLRPSQNDSPITGYGIGLSIGYGFNFQN